VDRSEKYKHRNFFSRNCPLRHSHLENKRQRQITAAKIKFVRWAEEYAWKYYRNHQNFVDEGKGRICIDFRRNRLRTLTEYGTENAQISKEYRWAGTRSKEWSLRRLSLTQFHGLLCGWHRRRTRTSTRGTRTRRERITRTRRQKWWWW
jgi:hypothetical protein